MLGVAVQPNQPVSFNVAFDGLEHAERSILTLIYGAKLTLPQIAKRLSLSDQTVRTLASRALIVVGNRMCGISCGAQTPRPARIC